MATEILRDRLGRKIGELQDNGNEIIARDKLGRKVGSYDKRQNITRDRLGRKVGTGNLLASLIVQ